MDKTLVKTIKYRTIAFIGRILLMFVVLTFYPTLDSAFFGIILGELYAFCIYYLYEKHSKVKKK